VLLENGFIQTTHVNQIVILHGFSHHLVESIHVLSLAQLANTGTPLHQHVKLIVMLLSSMNPMPIFVFVILLTIFMMMVLASIPVQPHLLLLIKADKIFVHHLVVVQAFILVILLVWHHVKLPGYHPYNMVASFVIFLARLQNIGILRASNVSPIVMLVQ